MKSIEATIYKKVDVTEPQKNSKKEKKMKIR